jgi:hypothetical protein
MDKRLRYTAISRATSKDLINVITGSDIQYSATEDTNMRLLNRRQAEQRRSKELIYRKRKEALTIINSIVRHNNKSDEYCVSQTGISRYALFEHLGITERKGISLGYDLDHIKPRKEFKSIEELEMVNHYSNLRLLPKRDNIQRNFR